MKLEIIHLSEGVRPLFGCPICGGISEAFFKRCPQCGQRVKERRRRRSTKHGVAKRWRIYERDGFQCLKCGTTTNLTLDHIVARARGGPNGANNLQTLCARCNGQKKSQVVDYRVLDGERWG